MDINLPGLDHAISNLLFGCAGLVAGDRLVVVQEADGGGFYDDRIAEVVTSAAMRFGIDAVMHAVPFQREVKEIPESLVADMRSAHCTIFFARLGDQLRFCTLPPGPKVVVCYTLDLLSFASTYGSADYRAFLELKLALDAMIGQAETLHVTCPRGTDFSGPAPTWSKAPAVDTIVLRFPISIFAPVPAAEFSGKAVLAGFLMGTGSRYYDPYAVFTKRCLTAHFELGRMTGFTGDPDDVAVANAHYDRVAQKFGIDRNVVHSWHAGIHPGCTFHESVEHSFLRWSSGAFGNPRLLHVHSCGAYAPGEISWNIMGPTIRIDGVAVWEGGSFSLSACRVALQSSRGIQVSLLYLRNRTRVLALVQI